MCCGCVDQCVVKLLREGTAAISDTFACFGTRGGRERDWEKRREGKLGSG